MNDILFGLLEAILIAGLATVFRYVIPYITQSLRRHNYNFAAEIIEYLVRAAEQTILGTGQGDIRFKFVLEQAKKQLEQYGIDITDAQICQLIESAVQVMNAEITYSELYLPIEEQTDEPEES